MDFLKSSISDEYLYSPLTWLHRKNTCTKVLLVWIKLIFLAYVPLNYILIYLLGSICFCKIEYIPKKLKQYFQRISIIFIFFAIINRQRERDSEIENANRQIRITIHDFSNLCIYFGFCEAIKIKKVELLTIYLPISIIRLLSLSLIYLISIKILALTTRHEKIINLSLKFKNSVAYELIKQFNFEVMTASQFLKIALQEIDITSRAYIIRNGIDKKKRLQKENLILLWLLVKHFLLQIYQYTYYISCTLHSRNINKLKLKPRYNTRRLYKYEFYIV